MTTGFKFQISGVGSDHYANCATAFDCGQSYKRPKIVNYYSRLVL